MLEPLNQSNIDATASSPAVSPLTKIFASALYTGFSPVASGTAGSLIGLLIYFLPSFEKTFVILPLSFIVLVLGAFAAKKMETAYGPDPRQVTIDEVLGMWISLLFLQKTIMIAVLTFIIFRIMDIIKPWPARFFDKRSGGWSIMLDDVVAGIYTNLLLQICLFFFT